MENISNLIDTIINSYGPRSIPYVVIGIIVYLWFKGLKKRIEDLKETNSELVEKIRKKDEAIMNILEDRHQDATNFRTTLLRILERLNMEGHIIDESG